MACKRKLAVGYQLPDLDRFADIVAAFRAEIDEVYFPWIGVPESERETYCREVLADVNR